jgi:hypothetical protein
MSNRLPETDLANWALLPASLKRKNLEGHEKPKSIPGSYEPFRRVFPDAINQQFPLFGAALEGSRWVEVEKRLRQQCKGNADLIKMNKEILHATHDFAVAEEISAHGLEVQPLRFFGGTNYFFGLSMVVRYPKKASLIFLDMRRKGLSPAGRNFVFSALHHRFREAYPDLRKAELEIWRYRNNKARDLVCHEPTHDIMPWDMMVDQVVDTHRLWDEVRRGGADERRSTGTFGPLFD